MAYDRLYWIIQRHGNYNKIIDKNQWIDFMTTIFFYSSNALSLDMMSQLLTDIKRNQQDENLRCIVLSGNGPVFSAGHNLKELTKETGIDHHQKIFDKCTELMLELAKSPVPIIGRVDGLAAAAGCQLAATCDILVCSDRSSFSTPG